MDKVRFGRALGYGARHAAKAFVQAADAATTGEPKATNRPNAQSVIGASDRLYTPRPAARVALNPGQAKTSALHPLKRYSGGVLLQVVGTFFAVFALLMAQNAWKVRDGVHLSVRTPESQHFWLLLALCCLFTWFAVSSFLRARRIGRD